MTKKVEKVDFDILTKSHMPHVILAVGKELLVNFSAITTYVATIRTSMNQSTIKSCLDKLAELELLEKKPIPDTSRDEYTYHAYPILEQLARKLSYVFDSDREVYPLSKVIVEQLKDYAQAEKLESWEKLVDQAITELMNKLKIKYPVTPTS